MLPSSGAEHDMATLLCRQLQAVDAWNCERHAREARLSVAGPYREVRLDAVRELEAVSRAHRALIEYLGQELAGGSPRFAESPAPRAIVAHRQLWFARTLRIALSELGVRVVATCDNGADAVGVVVAEQPELLLVEECLPGMSGRQVIDEALQFAHATVPVVQVTHSSRIADFLAAGARAVLTRQVPPADVARQMLAVIQGASPPKRPAAADSP